MSELNLTIDSKAQKNRAFLQAAPTSLGHFTLPTNLNNKLASNKQKQKEATTTQRPRLSSLSTALPSQRDINNVFEEETVIDISLPKITRADLFNSSSSSSTIQKELRFMTIIATSLCLFSSCFLLALNAEGKNSNRKIYSLFLGEWMLLSGWLQLNNNISTIVTAAANYLFQYTITSSIIMLVITGWSQQLKNSSALLLLIPQCATFAGTLLFYIAFRLSKIESQQQDQLLEQLQAQQTKTQVLVDKELSAYKDRRKVFLSTLSQDIRDASLMITATLEQFSPSSILTSTHELLSACSIAVPIASISAISTIIKQTSHISSHLNLVSRTLRETYDNNTTQQQEKVRKVISTASHDFDVGEMIQNIGDAMAGMSTKLGVHFIIYHIDNGLYFSNVVGDENAIKHALIKLLRNILEGCTPGACIELGLLIEPIPETPQMKVVFDIVQTASPSIPAGVSAALIPNANFTSQLISYIGGKMKLEDLGKNKTRVKVTLELFPGRNSDQRLLFIEKPSQILERRLQNIKFSNEPTLEDLNVFITALKGVKMILHALEKSVFAKHLTSCLTSWNADISHVPVSGYIEDEESVDMSSSSDVTTVMGSDSDTTSIASQTIQQQSQLRTPMIEKPNSLNNRDVINSNAPVNSNINSSNNINKIPSPAIEEDHIHSIPPTFILIDDDILTLERKLREIRDQPPIPPAVLLQQQKKHRRSKSRLGTAASNNNENIMMHGTIAIVFFTSLENYKRVRDTVHWFSSLDNPPYLPRVIVVPKPAGPRRFLTALHTAWNNAVVEPQFTPIATSPYSLFTGGGVNYQASPQLSQTDSVGTPTGLNNGPSTASQQQGMLTPYDNDGGNTRYSPGGRRTAVGGDSGGGIMRTNGLYSPSNLQQIESEKGNYFFGPSRGASVAAAAAAATIHGNNGVSAINNVPGLPTAAATLSMIGASNGGLSNINTTSSALNIMSNNNTIFSPIGMNSANSSGLNATPTEIKRRLRSHSNAYASSGGTATPLTKRGLVDLSFSSDSSLQQRGEDSPRKLSATMNSITPLTMTSRSGEPVSVDYATINDIKSPLQDGNAQKEKEILTGVQAIETNEAQHVADNDAKSTTSVAVTSPNSPSATAATASPPVKLKSKLSNFKFNNRKRKEKGNTSDKKSPPINVLIVEDNMINQAILSTWMKKHGIQFSVASDGKEAVEKWKGGGFHLILMDIQLPVMDGIQATKMIRGIEKERKIGVLPSSSSTTTTATSATAAEEKPRAPSPTKDTIEKPFQSPIIIVALTASSLESDRQAALAAGCNDFLTKPVSLAWLDKKIMEWGCMQALIDFEGWRKWIKTKATHAATSSITSSNNTKNFLLPVRGMPSSMSKEALEIQTREKEQLALRTQEFLKDESRAIVLIGANKRRMSSIGFDEERVALNKAALGGLVVEEEREGASSLPLLSQISSSISNSNNNVEDSNNNKRQQKAKKRLSDSDLYTKFSIPKQVEAREQKIRLEEEHRLQEQQRQEDEDSLEEDGESQ